MEREVIVTVVEDYCVSSQSLKEGDIIKFTKTLYGDIYASINKAEYTSGHIVSEKDNYEIDTMKKEDILDCVPEYFTGIVTNIGTFGSDYNRLLKVKIMISVPEEAETNEVERTSTKVKALVYAESVFTCKDGTNVVLSKIKNNIIGDYIEVWVNGGDKIGKVVSNISVLNKDIKNLRTFEYISDLMPYNVVFSGFITETINVNIEEEDSSLCHPCFIVEIDETEVDNDESKQETVENIENVQEKIISEQTEEAKETVTEEETKDDTSSETLRLIIIDINGKHLNLSLDDKVTLKRTRGDEDWMGEVIGCFKDGKKIGFAGNPNFVDDEKVVYPHYIADNIQNEITATVIEMKKLSVLFNNDYDGAIVELNTSDLCGKVNIYNSKRKTVEEETEEEFTKLEQKFDEQYENEERSKTIEEILQEEELERSFEEDIEEDIDFSYEEYLDAIDETEQEESSETILLAIANFYNWMRTIDLSINDKVTLKKGTDRNDSSYEVISCFKDGKEVGQAGDMRLLKDDRIDIQPDDILDCFDKEIEGTVVELKSIPILSKNEKGVVAIVEFNGDDLFDETTTESETETEVEAEAEISENESEVEEETVPATQTAYLTVISKNKDIQVGTEIRIIKKEENYPLPVSLIYWADKYIGTAVQNKNKGELMENTCTFENVLNRINEETVGEVVEVEIINSTENKLKVEIQLHSEAFNCLVTVISHEKRNIPVGTAIRLSEMDKEEWIECDFLEETNLGYGYKYAMASCGHVAIKNKDCFPGTARAKDIYYQIPDTTIGIVKHNTNTFDTLGFDILVVEVMTMHV